jgi:hypothetical protein
MQYDAFILVMKFNDAALPNRQPLRRYVLSTFRRFAIIRSNGDRALPQHSDEPARRVQWPLRSNERMLSKGSPHRNGSSHKWRIVTTSAAEQVKFLDQEAH